MAKRSFLYRAGRALARRTLIPLRRWSTSQLELHGSTSAETKAIQRLLYHQYRTLVESHAAPKLAETGFRNFSHAEEDGKLLFIFAALGIHSGTFVEIGAFDGINSNCANLALNHGWHGVFVEGDNARTTRGENFYNNHPDTRAYPPRFINAMVTRENIDQLLQTAGVPADVDLMSIDIDGNDYWVWDAITAVRPKVVIIETHVEFGHRSIVVPYDSAYVHPGRHPDYHGASPPAMQKLGARKGYRLVGANAYGYNTIYVLRGLAEESLPEISVEEVLAHPRNVERAARFEPIKAWEYVEV